MTRLAQNSWSATASHAFTRVDLLILLAAVALVALVALPGLATTQPRSERLICFNNLRRVGIACHAWADAHGDRNVWVADASEGGTRRTNTPLANQAWWQWSFMSNELATPRILACPSDASTRVATDFSTSPDGGFLHPDYRNNAVSYFIGLHSVPAAPRSLLAGDRNLRVSSVGPLGCSFGSVTIATRLSLRPPDPGIGWTNAIHGETGNLLWNDGSVQQSSAADVQTFLREKAGDDSGVEHILQPR
jgi:prepilin-type processing-associated H-X9-DG protein